MVTLRRGVAAAVVAAAIGAGFGGGWLTRAATARTTVNVEVPGCTFGGWGNQPHNC